MTLIRGFKRQSNLALELLRPNSSGPSDEAGHPCNFVTIGAAATSLVDRLRRMQGENINVIQFPKAKR